MVRRNKYKKKRSFVDFKTQTIKRQNDEINRLRTLISELEIDNKQKELLLNQVDETCKVLRQSIAEISECRERYEKLIDDLFKMRKVMNQEVFKGRWNIIRMLIK